MTKNECIKLLNTCAAKEIVEILELPENKRYKQNILSLHYKSNNPSFLETNDVSELSFKDFMNDKSIINTMTEFYHHFLCEKQDLYEVGNFRNIFEDLKSKYIL